MAKKNDNTLLWVAAGGIGLYFLWKNIQTPLNTTSTTILPASPAPTPVLMLPQSLATQNAIPAGVSNMPVNNTPAPVNVTGLVPAVLTNSGAVAPGQPIAVNSAGVPITTGTSIPLVFADPSSLAAQKWMGIQYNQAVANQALNGYEEVCDL